MQSDHNTSIMMGKISTNPLYVWLEKDIQQNSTESRPHFCDGCITLSQQRLIVTQPISAFQDSLILIIVPVSLLLVIFSAYLCSPTSGHLACSKLSVKFNPGTFGTVAPCISKSGWPPVYTALLYNPITVYPASSAPYGPSQPRFPSCTLTYGLQVMPHLQTDTHTSLAPCTTSLALSTLPLSKSSCPTILLLHLWKGTSCKWVFAILSMLISLRKYHCAQ